MRSTGVWMRHEGNELQLPTYNGLVSEVVVARIVCDQSNSLYNVILSEISVII